MTVIIRRLLADERVRFVLIGGINTVLGYGLFVLFELTVGDLIGYLGSLYASYIPAICVAFILHRRFTFQVSGTGSVAVDFLRFSSVYVVSLVINTIALPLLVELARMDTLVAQALIVVVTTLVSYFGHKLFSFRRGPAAAPSIAPTGTVSDQ